MDYDKSIFVDEFLQFKNTKKNSVFFVKVQYLYDNKHWMDFGEAKLEIQNSVKKSDYVFIFYDDLIGTNPYLKHFQFDMDYLDNIKFDGQYLYFTTSDGIAVKLN